MELSLKAGQPSSIKTGCLVIGLFEGNKLTATGSEIDAASGNALSRLIKRGDIEGKPCQTLLLQGLDGVAAERILLVGLGKQDKFDPLVFRKAMTRATQVLGELGAADACFAIDDLAGKSLDPYWAARHTAEAVNFALYRYETTKSEKAKPRKLKRVGLLQCGSGAPRGSGAPHRDYNKSFALGLKHGNAVSNGMNLARELANLPGNICTPTYLANQAKALAKAYPKLKVKILEEADMKRLGMGSLLSVSRGSRQPAKLIVMEWMGGKKGDKPHALVGKGLTFDTGGISLKPGPGMDEMKFDMCGSASVFGTMRAVVELGLKVNCVGVVPSSENMPDGDASKPGDIVTTMAGLTVEVLNTDAEGRLILCDALTYTERTYKPKTVIDIATLTGAVVIALGSHATGLMSNDDKLADSLYALGQQTGDRVWRLPLWDDYKEQLKSNFADMANIGGREAGTITAAIFLSRFTEKMRWAHLDIAGTAYKSGTEKGALGRPVSLLTQYLIEQA
ncbi:MAG: leucyl aminopeptidase [Xanthomonadaceae bacterium]|nr:leucyl aminopeptidase [Xanthomonadaceae bacterium]